MTFEKSYNRLKQINELLQSDTILEVDEILKLQKEATELYEYCNKELEKLPNE